MDSENRQGSNFLSISQLSQVERARIATRTLSTVLGNLQTMKFEECPRRNVSSFNLEILRDLSSPLRNSFVIFFGFPISSFPSFIILLKFRQCRFGSIRIFVFLAHLPPWFPEESKVISRLERGQDSIRRGLRTSWSITTNRGFSSTRMDILERIAFFEYPISDRSNLTRNEKIWKM